MKHAAIRIMVARHSAFYSPLIATIAAGLLREEGLEATYAVLPMDRRSHDLLRNGEVDIVQSAVSSNWGPLERGEGDLPVHFAQINQRDGFFLAGRAADPSFEWRKLEDKSLLADHGRQPLVMLKYAAHCQGVDWGKIKVIDAGTPEEMAAVFRSGRGDYVHLQGPAPHQLEKDAVGHIVASVGEAMPPVAFSSLMATRAFLRTDTARAFMRAYRKAREWADQAPAREIARVEASFFPGIEFEALAAAIASYQELGCWDGDVAIPRELYDQALDVFLHSGAVSRRHLYEEVVIPPCTG
jgi:NitT/TauT family transport system substrate-binding protein